MTACWQAHRKRLNAAFLSILLSRDKFPFIGSLPCLTSLVLFARSFLKQQELFPYERVSFCCMGFPQGVKSLVKHVGELKSHASCCTIGQKSQASQAVSSQLELATQPSHEAKPPDHPVWEKLTFHIPSYPTIYRSLYSRNVKSFQRELCERNPREKQD